ncbi:MAG: hypothetical protein CMJ64_10235 [Planctomycetaceae bacterium]|nr:hypothetical protein [Planctomycetaceae bacterium]
MRTRSQKLLALAIAVTLSSMTPALAKDGESNDFLRIRRDDSGTPLAMETSITSFASADESQSVTVDLVGAVHIADKAYFDELNKAFASYDAVLYELVAPHNVTPNPGERSASAVSFLQTTMKSVLGLQFQLDCVDYKKPNFVHADMTPEEFASTMKERGESFAQMFLRMFGQSIAMQSRDPGRSSDAQLLAALFASPEERARRMKRIMAEQFQDMDAATSVLDGPNGSTILTERNKAALRVLKTEMAKGKKKRIAIFYGAAHLPDMEERLISEFKLKRTGLKWVTAWDLESKPKEKPPAE